MRRYLVCGPCPSRLRNRRCTIDDATANARHFGVHLACIWRVSLQHLVDKRLACSVFNEQTPDNHIVKIPQSGSLRTSAQFRICRPADGFVDLQVLQYFSLPGVQYTEEGGGLFQHDQEPTLFLFEFKFSHAVRLRIFYHPLCASSKTFDTLDEVQRVRNKLIPRDRPVCLPEHFQ